MHYNKHNFFRNTFCEFTQIDNFDLKGKTPDYKSKSGSNYYFTNEGVYRVANHWGRAANCRWRLLPNSNYKNQTIICAFANWTDFYPNDETQKWYFIDYNGSEILFQHKNSIKFKNQVLRNAKETQKRIQELKKIIETNNWFTYLIGEIEVIRMALIHDLIFTDKPLFQLFSKYR